MRTFPALLLVAAGAGSLTPVRGPSWLQRLGIELDDTHMGKMGGEGTPPANQHKPMPRIEGGESEAAFTIRGKDLYRFACQACHGPDGRGSPPEINSLLDPVRATSAALLEARQRKQGRPLPPEMARELAADAEKNLRDRLTNGGKKMPPFPHLSENEVVALLSHLKSLAGVPAVERPSPQLTMAAVEVGENLVKGTCHVCHPATGPNPSHMDMYMRGVIPSLASVATERTASAVIAKVREGRMTMMGGGGMMTGPGMMGRRMMGRMGRMPVLSYLTDEEVMAAYLFLSKYPPQAE